MRFNCHRIHQQVFIEAAIAPEDNLLHAMLPALFDVVYQRDLVGVTSVVGRYLHIKVAFFLKEVREVTTTLLDEVGINAALRVNGDQVFLPAVRQKGNPRESRALYADVNHRAQFRTHKDVGVIGVGMVSGVIELNLALQSPPPGQIALHQGDTRIHSLWTERLSRFERSTRESCSQGLRVVCEAVTFRRWRANHLEAADLRPFAEVYVKDYVGKQIGLVEVRFSPDLRLKVAAADKELLQCSAGRCNRFPGVRRLGWDVEHLEETGVRKPFGCSWKVEDTEVQSWLQGER